MGERMRERREFLESHRALSHEDDRMCTLIPIKICWSIFSKVLITALFLGKLWKHLQGQKAGCDTNCDLQPTEFIQRHRRVASFPEDLDRIDSQNQKKTWEGQGDSKEY